MLSKASRVRMGHLMIRMEWQRLNQSRSGRLPCRAEVGTPSNATCGSRPGLLARWIGRRSASNLGSVSDEGPTAALPHAPDVLASNCWHHSEPDARRTGGHWASQRKGEAKLVSILRKRFLRVFHQCRDVPASREEAQVQGEQRCTQTLQCILWHM